ncbi:hypothetical protein CCACVL1_08222 [Corchorus capsularis]|uniref:Uncharacterized protein n=1 Tax=Corchorus capsularis TaxID=210143 RepID=A0A1R3J1V9_COCAP|nr:hypothetical protein CCACVL1_08222 [Corchorus capsularis]
MAVGKKQDGETSGKGTIADEDEGEGDGGAPPQKEEEEEQQYSSITIAASPQIAVDQKQNHENGGSNIMNPSQLIHQRHNNMMLPQATYPPMLPYYYSNGYNADASTSGLPDFPEYVGLGQDLACYNGNFVPTAAPILPRQFPSLPENYGFTDDERSQDFSFEQ